MDGPWQDFQPQQAQASSSDGPWNDFTRPEAKVPDATQGPSLMQRVGHGVMDTVYGLGQLASHVLPIPLPTKGLSDWKLASTISDEANQAREQEYQSERAAGGQTGADWGRIAGQVLSPANYVPVGPLARGAVVADAALRGAISGASEPVTKGDYWTRKGYQVAEGAGGGAVAGAAGKAIAGAVSPALDRAQQTLVDQGVSLTPGQMAGGIARRTEEIAKRFPILGNFIRSGEGKSIESFNTATIDQALDPIGQRLPRGMEAGHDAIAYAQRTIGDAYDNLLPRMRFTVDPQFSADIGNLRTLAGEMPPAQAEQFENILQNRVMRRLGQQQTMDGQTLKQVDSELRVSAENARSSQDAAQRQLGIALDEVRSSLRDGLTRQNPRYAGDLADIDSSYAMLTRVENAASRRIGSQGVFSPGDLAQAVKQGDRTARKRAFARGDALMQDWAEAANQVIPNKVPDSGTAERQHFFDVLGAGGVGALGVTHPYGLVAGLAALPAYTDAGMNALRRYVDVGPTRQAARRLIEQAAPYTAPSGAYPAIQLLAPNYAGSPWEQLVTQSQGAPQ